MRTEELNLEGGDAILDVRGGDLDVSFAVNEKHFATAWSDCAGSIGQYLVFHARRRGLASAAEFLRNVTRGPPPLDEGLGSRFSGFTRLFTSGQYRLEYWGEDVPSYGVSEHVIWCDVSRRHPFYPYELALIATMAQDQLDQTMVAQYRARISRGERPLVLCAAIHQDDTDLAFVVDGHHKLMAYGTALPKVRPHLLILRRLDPEPLTKKELEERFTRDVDRESYLALKAPKPRAPTRVIEVSPGGLGRVVEPSAEEPQ